MAAPQRLQSGSISPSARPVDTFLSFDSNSRPATPTRPQLMPQTPRVTTLQRGNQRSVQGVNSLAELTEALQPLSKLYDQGVELYASDQYQRGQNEILRAAANVNRDQIIKGYKYAEDNRLLSSQNPIAGVLMDQSNPFRRAGQINQASQWAASLVPDLMRAQWLKYGADLAKVDPTSPAVSAVQAQVANAVTQSLGLDEFSPGFQQYVVPQINRSYEWLANEQLKANVKYQKDVGVTQTSELLNSIIRQGLFSGNGVDKDQWRSALNEAAARFGITGEPQKMTENAILQSLEYWTAIAFNPSVDAGKRALALEAIGAINGLWSGAVDAEGKEIPVGIAFPGSTLSAQADIARDLKALSDSQNEIKINAATDYLAGQNVSPSALRPGSPELDGLVQTLKEKFGISTFEAMEVIKAGISVTTDFEQNIFDIDSLNSFFSQADGLVGSDWDEAVQRRKFNELTINATGQNLIEANRRWNELKARKASEQRSNIDRTTIKDSINQAAKAAVLKLYPTDGVAWIQLAQERGQTILEYLSLEKGDSAAAIQRITNDLQRTIISRIQKETAENKGPLSFTKQGEIAQEEIDKLMKDDAKLRQLAEIPEPKAEQTQKKEEPEKPVEIPQVYLPGASVPESAAKGNAPIYSKEDTSTLVSLAFRGRPIPAGVKRAARAASMTPGQFILKQMDLHGLETTDEVRQKILRDSNRSMGAENALYAAIPANTPVARSSGVLVDILLGTAPSYSRSA